MRGKAESAPGGAVALVSASGVCPFCRSRVLESRSSVSPFRLAWCPACGATCVRAEPGEKP